MAEQAPVLEAARSVIRKPLPPLPTDLKRDKDGNLPVSIVLFYQYMEPAWSEVEHRNALKTVLEIAKKHNVMGRGRYRHPTPPRRARRLASVEQAALPHALHGPQGLCVGDDQHTHVHTVPGSAPEGR